MQLLADRLVEVGVVDGISELETVRRTLKSRPHRAGPASDAALGAALHTTPGAFGPYAGRPEHWGYSPDAGSSAGLPDPERPPATFRTREWIDVRGMIGWLGEVFALLHGQ